MSPRPIIFISAVSKELKSARQLVSNTLQFLGYEPVWQDIFGTEQGDLRSMLREKIDGCKGVVQLVGETYGAEPPAPDKQFGRVSYTQYEALYARQRGKKVWYLFLNDDFPADAHEPEAEELRELQASYRRRLQSESQLYHPLNSREALEASVLKLRDDLTRLRRGFRQWAAAVIVLLVILVGAVIWMKSGQHTDSQQESEQLRAIREEMAKIRQSMPQAVEVQTQARREELRKGPAESQRNADTALDQWAIQQGIDPKQLRKAAREIKDAPDASTYERANAAYVARDYNEAERLALAAADEAQKASPPKHTEAIKALELAGNSAEVRIEYAEALEHYRAGAELTDRSRDPMEWARLQWNIARLLHKQGSYAEAEKTYRNALDEYRRARGEEDKSVLGLRNNLAAVLDDQGNYAGAEAEYRPLLKLQEKALGPEHPDTLNSRNSLAAVLSDQGKSAEAESELRTVINVEEKVLGPEHPLTLSSRNNLAAVLSDQRKYAEAEGENQEVIKLEEKVFGPEHPLTLASRMNRALTFNDQGKYAEAEAEFREVIKLQEKVLGPEHPDTLKSRGGLAGAFLSQEKYAEAETEFRQLIKLREKVLGPQHPETLMSQHGLASTLSHEGKYADAVEVQEAILAVIQGKTGDEQERNRELTDGYGSLSWYQLFAKDFAGALASADAGHKLDDSDLPLESNRAHALSFLGRTKEAEKIYLQHRGLKYSNKTWEQVILGDFDDLEKAGLTSPEFDHIRELFKTETNPNTQSKNQNP